MIGVFDSGLGGLSVLKQMMSKSSHRDYIYLADTARVPYGSRSLAELENIANNDVKFLIDKGCDVVVAACGTASSVLKDYLFDESGREYIMAIDCAAIRANRAVNREGAKKIALLATAATVNSGSFQKTLGIFGTKAEVVGIACPDFVTLIEEGIEENREALEKAAQKYLAKIGDADTVVLGCTHFPLIKDIIRKYTDARIIDISHETANFADSKAEYIDRRMAEEAGIYRILDGPAYKAFLKRNGSVNFFVSGDVNSFVEKSSKIMGFNTEPFTKGFHWL